MASFETIMRCVRLAVGGAVLVGPCRREFVVTGLKETKRGDVLLLSCITEKLDHAVEVPLSLEGFKLKQTPTNGQGTQSG